MKLLRVEAFGLLRVKEQMLLEAKRRVTVNSKEDQTCNRSRVTSVSQPQIHRDFLKSHFTLK